MEIPIRFPDHLDVIREDSLRFQALNDADKFNELGKMSRMGFRQTLESARPEHYTAFEKHFKDSEASAIKEFIARHE